MSDRELQTEIYTNEKGERFRIGHWDSVEPAQGVLVVHHGIGEHLGRYQELADGLAAVPLSIWSYDARGHGESDGKRGHALGLEQFADDLEAMLPVLMEKSGQSRVFVIGHSMGAAVLASYATSRAPHPSIEGFIFSAPPFAVQLDFVTKLKVSVARGLAKLKPDFTLPTGLSADNISSVPEEVERYQADPQVHDLCSAALGRSLIDDAPALLQAAGKIHLPTFVFHGAEDGIASVDGGRALAKSLGTDDVQYEELLGARHEIIHETPEIRARLFSALSSWLKARLATDAAAARASA